MPGTLNVGGHDIITHSGDAGAGDVTINVQDRLVLDSSGNVGIGTSSPTSFGASYKTIHFKNTSGDAIFLTESDGGIVNEIQATDAGGFSTFGTRSNHPIVLKTNDTERMRIDSSGRVGINEVTPLARLHVQSGGSPEPAFFVTNTNADITWGTADNFQLGEWDGTTFTQRMIIDTSGNIGAPSGSNIYNASDQRLKQNITDLSGCLQKVLSMRGVSFNWIDEFCDSEADKTLYGLIAQELQTVDSNLVDSFSDNTITAGSVTVENPLRVNEKFIIPMLVESIKEQQSIIEALTTRIEALENA
jgi:hypothetical protein